MLDGRQARGAADYSQRPATRWRLRPGARRRMTRGTSPAEIQLKQRKVRNCRRLRLVPVVTAGRLDSHINAFRLA